MHININLCPSCLHTTTAFRSFQPESQILPQSPWRYTSTRPSFLLLPPTRRTRGPDRKRKKHNSHSYSCRCTYILQSALTESYMTTDSVKCHLQPGVSLSSLYSHSNGPSVYRRHSKHLFILSAVNMWHLNSLESEKHRCFLTEVMIQPHKRRQKPFTDK